MADRLPLVREALGAAGATPSGPPFTRFLRLDSALLIEVGYPVDGPVQLPADSAEGLASVTLPAMRATQGIHRGPYERRVETYRLLELFHRRNGLESGGTPFEIYLTEPVRPDPNAVESPTWEMAILMPIK